MSDIIDSDFILECEDCPFVCLPEELILHICSFLEVKYILRDLKRVCKRFYKILCADNIYKSLYSARWKRPYLTVYPGDKIDWPATIFYVEKECKDIAAAKMHTEKSNAHITSVDAVKFVDNGRILFTGSRDKSIVVWKLSPSSSGAIMPEAIDGQLEAHDGWVWRICSIGDFVFSASWDHSIKQWDYKNSLVATNTFDCESPVLSMSGSEENVIYGGTINKSVFAFDFREKNKSLWSFKAHDHAILNVACWGNELITTCEDGLVAVWDLRSRKQLQKFTLKNNTYATWMQLLNNELFIGDNRGYLHMYCNEEGQLKCCVVERLQNDFILGMKVTEGCIWTAGRDGWLKAHLRVNPPAELWNSKHIPSNTSGMDYCNGNLAIGYNNVTFWTPLTEGGILPCCQVIDLPYQHLPHYLQCDT